MQSDWVSAELDLALQVQRAKGAERYRVIPLTLDETKLGAFKRQFGTEPTYIRLSSTAGGIDAALPALRAALRLALPADVPRPSQPQAKPVEDLVLELSDLDVQVDANSVRRARARARLVFQPADPARPAVHSKPWRLVAPIGPIEAEDLAWYLERYPIWPGTPYQARARQVEQDSTRRSASCWSARGPRTMPAAISTIAPRPCPWWMLWSSSAAWSR